MADNGDARLPDDLPAEETTDYLVGLSRRLGEESRALMRRIDEALEERSQRGLGFERVDGEEQDVVVNVDHPADAGAAARPPSSPFRRPS
jgi:hypothetical protein